MFAYISAGKIQLKTLFRKHLNLNYIRHPYSSYLSETHSSVVFETLVQILGLNMLHYTTIVSPPLP